MHPNSAIVDDEDFVRISKEEYEVWSCKGIDYTIGNADRLYNFKSIAEIIGITPEQVWAVYFWKHVCAVLSWAKTGRVESEGIKGRFIDIANYAKLGRLIAEEGKP